MSADYRGSASVPSALAEFEHVARWVAWREEPDANGKLRKVPYDPKSGRRANPTDPTNWADYATALKCAQGLAIGKGRRGVGIGLGRLDDELSLGGIDLDDCIDDRGRLEPWAAEIVARVNSYAEVSPSGDGTKVFFIYRTGDLPELKEALGGKLGRAFKDGRGRGVEVYLGGRYFTVTGDALDGPSDVWRAHKGDILWTLREAGPAFKAESERAESSTRDDSGSGHGFRFMMDRAGDGKTEEDAIGAILDDDGPAGEWANRVEDRDLERAFRNALKRVERRKTDRRDRMPDSDAEPPKESGLTFSSPRECSVADAAPYVVKGLINSGHLGCIVGAPGAGKSVLAPYLAYRVAQGEPVFGMRTKAGPVFYVAAEDEGGMRGRVSALRLELGDAPDFSLVGGVSNLLTSASLETLQQAVADRRPSLVVIDTLAEAFSGIDENTSDGMGRVIQAARSLTAWGAAVILVHHDTKDGDGRPRGWGGLHGTLEVSMSLTREGADVRCGMSKCKAGPSTRTFGFAIKTRSVGIDEDDELVRAVYAEERAARDMSPKKARLTKPQAAALSILVGLHEGRAAVPEGEWRKACVAGRKVCGSEIEESRRAAFRRAAGELAASDRVIFSDGAYSLEGLPE